MKFYSLIALAGAAVVAKAPPATDEDVIEMTPEEKIIHNIEGFKSFYSGYYKSFYHANSKDKAIEACMDDKTVDNMIALGKVMMNPMSMFEIKNLKDDMSLFGEAAEVAADLSSCHFEQSFFSIWGMCKEDKEACAIPKLTENLTKNMFVIVGKMTQMAETMTEMKDADNAEFNELMRGVGGDCGTMVRDVFAFTGKAPVAE